MRNFLSFLSVFVSGWLLLWRRVGDRWGGLAMANAWVEWGLALLGALALWHAARQRWALAGTALAATLLAAERLYRPLLHRTGSVGAAPPPTARLTLFSANLYKRSDSAAGHIELVHAQRPDVLCFQELTHPLAAQLEAALAGDYPHRAWRPADGAWGFGVMSRWPLSETGYWESPGVKPWAQRVRVALPTGETVELYNAHLVAPTAASTVALGLRWGFRTREAQVRAVQSAMAERGLPAALVGDLNFADSHDAYRLACTTLHDGWLGAGRGPRWTWPTRHFPAPFVPWNPRLLRLDYCFHNDGLATDAMQVLGSRTGSDHCPLLVRLAVRGGRAASAE